MAKRTRGGWSTALVVAALLLASSTVHADIGGFGVTAEPSFGLGNGGSSSFAFGDVGLRAALQSGVVGPVALYADVQWLPLGPEAVLLHTNAVIGFGAACTLWLPTNNTSIDSQGNRLREYHAAGTYHCRHGLQLGVTYASSQQGGEASIEAGYGIAGAGHKAITVTYGLSPQSIGFRYQGLLWPNASRSIVVSSGIEGQAGFGDQPRIEFLLYLGFGYGGSFGIDPGFSPL